MKYACTVRRTVDGRFVARHAGDEFGVIESTAATHDEAVAKLKGELRYRLELCPCSGESYQHLEVEIVE